MSFTDTAFSQQLDLFLQNKDEDRDMRPLLRAILEHVRSGAVQFSELGPILGVIWFRVTEYDCSRWARFWGRASVQWFHLFTAKRPLWNDFYMCLWMLSHDQKYVCELHRHLYTAIRKRRFDQASTGQWMIHSVCEQDLEFKSYWNLATAQHGELFS